jgi:ATP-dependent Zn protease
VRALLADHLELLHKLANTLLERETLNADEFAALLA